MSIFCSDCGCKITSESANFCPSCGSLLKKSIKDNGGNESDTLKKRVKVLFVKRCILVCFLWFVLISVFFIMMANGDMSYDWLTNRRNDLESAYPFFLFMGFFIIVSVFAILYGVEKEAISGSSDENARVGNREKNQKCQTEM